MGGSQLKQLKTAISTSGLSNQSAPSRKRKRGSSAGGAVLEHRDKRTEKLKEIHEKFNPFDVKVEKLKHDVGGRKIKGVMGKPSASKQAGIEQRKKTLLVEYESKDKVGGLVDKRFGENDPTMSLEERMLARFTKERQRSSKGALYNLEDEDELTHYGQSLSKLDDFDNAGLNLDDEEQDDAGQIDADTVKTAHFQGFSDDEDEDDDDENGPPRKKTKAEVMSEVIAKSKEHKYARQLQREQDENTRHTLDEDFDAIRGILFSKPPPKTPAPIPPLTNPNSTSADSKPSNAMDMDKDYDVFVRELAMEKRAQPKDRTKTEEEIALEEKEALELAEKRRLRRMMGEKEDSDDETGRRRGGGGDDLDDDFMLDEDLVSGLGAGLQSAKDQDEEDEEEDEEEESDSEADEEPESDDDAQEYGPSDEGEEAEEGDMEELIPTRPSKKKGKRSPKTKKGELPFTFPCPADHDEFLDILEDVDESMIATVVERIRKLYHPSLHVDNKSKLQGFIGVLLDHIIDAAAQAPPSLAVVEALVPHIYSLSKAYPVNSAEFFVAKLNLLQKNLTRGLQDPLEPSSKTFPGTPELVFLRVLGAIWSTSDMKHAVVGPAKCLMGAYLGLGRVRDLKDIASGLYLCSLFMQYEELSKRFIPEAANFIVQSLLILCPSSYSDAESIPGNFFIPDLDLIGSSLRFRLKKAGEIEPGRPNLFAILAGDENGQQEKLDLLILSLELIERYAEMYKSLDGFIELYDPISQILPNLSTKRLSTSTQQRISRLTDKLSRLLKFARQARKPLLLQVHKPIPIATYIPKFDAHSSSYIRNHDPDAERAALAKLKAQHRKEKKGAMRELRKDNRFLAGVQQEKQEAKDREYKSRMARVFSGLESERAEQRKEEKDKRREQRRAGKRK